MTFSTDVPINPPPHQILALLENKVLRWHLKAARSAAQNTRMEKKKLLTTNGLQNKSVRDNLGVAGQVHWRGRRHAGHNKRVSPERRERWTEKQAEEK